MWEGVVWSKLGQGTERLDIMSVYNSGDLKGALNTLEGWEEIGEVKLIIGGDFNIRIGELGGDSMEGRVRSSKDKVISNEGERMWNMIAEKGWILLNGWDKGNACGEYTYVGARGSSVIDYVIVKAKGMEDVSMFKVGLGIESDHAPLELRICSHVAGKGQNQ